MFTFNQQISHQRDVDLRDFFRPLENEVDIYMAEVEARAGRGVCALIPVPTEPLAAPSTPNMAHSATPVQL